MADLERLIPKSSRYGVILTPGPGRQFLVKTSENFLYLARKVIINNDLRITIILLENPIPFGKAEDSKVVDTVMVYNDRVEIKEVRRATKEEVRRIL
jgi:hypothetical protein